MKTLVWADAPGTHAVGQARNRAPAFDGDAGSRARLSVRPPAPRFLARYGPPALVAVAVHVAIFWWPHEPAPSGGSGDGDGWSEAASPEPASSAHAWSELALLPSVPDLPMSESENDDHPPESLTASESAEAEPDPAPRAPDAFAQAARLAAAATAPPPGAHARWTVGNAAPDSAALAAALRRSLPAANQSSLASRSRAGTSGWGPPALGNGPPDCLDVTQLDREPALLRVPEFTFPAHLSRQGIHSGRVTVVVRVDPHGRVHLLSVAESSHPDLIPAVCEATPKALFQPPLRHGRPVGLRYSWTLELRDRTHT